MMYARKWFPVQCALILLLVSPLAAEEVDSYQLPPEAVQDIISRDKSYATLNAVGPDGGHFLVPLTTELSTLEKMAEETYRLAMLELRPKVNREWRLDTYGINGLRIFSLERRSFRDIELPDGALVSDMMWSPDGTKIAFLAHLPQGSQVWTADVQTGETRPLSDAFVMATLAGRPSWGRSSTAASRLLQWTPQGTVLTLLVPSDRGPEPSRTVPSGPVIRRTREKPAPTRTQPFLLRDENDKALFRYYTTAQLAELSPGDPDRPVGEPAIYMEFSLSPDGKYILTEKIDEPLSYIVGYSGFPKRLDVMDLDGKVVSTIREVPLQEDQTKRPSEILKDFPREVTWLAEGSTLGFLWSEEKKEDDEGDSEDETPRLDRLATLTAPFDPSAAKIHVDSKVKDRSFGDLAFSKKGRLAFVTVSNSETKKDSIVAYDLSGDEAIEKVLAGDYDTKELVQLPGEIWTKSTSNGIAFALLSADGKHAYLRGEGYKEDYKPQPFVDRVTIASGEKARVFEGSKEMFEQPLVALDSDLKQMIVQRESKTVFPDSYLWKPTGGMDNLTRNQDPFPELTAAQRIDFTFTRRDGVEVQARISLPTDYQSGQRVPAMFWTYPREYSSVEDYERDALEDRNHNAFNQLRYLRWSDIWLSQGYALVAPDVPIIAKGNTYNDKYIQHMVDTLYAAIRKVDEMGMVDIDRIGHGGHSYGAFATANLLANSPFFKAGIAGNGAYNRTLTPMGFQSERRFIWDVQGLYLEMSPFFKADHIDTPLLMYHGADDNNTGTYPIQSERLMQALTGLGKTAVLYLYPFESHSPRAKKTYLDLWARWLEWFDKYVKKSEQPETN
jgi:dipeptidyl aminopeptidase/acylaminoacyl peptidase